MSIYKLSYNVRRSNIFEVYLSGKAFEEKGDIAKAIEQYEKFLDFWKDPNPRIIEVTDTKKRLAKLK